MRHLLGVLEGPRGDLVVVDTQALLDGVDVQTPLSTILEEPVT